MSGNRDIIRRREKYLAPSFSLSYQEPLHIVRGEGQYLYDVNGKKYGFEWTVEKVTENGDFKDCWMTVGVSRPMPLSQAS